MDNQDTTPHAQPETIPVAGMAVATSDSAQALQPVENAAPDGFDLDAVQDIFEAEIELFNPKNGQGLGAFVTLAGPEHPTRKTKQVNVRNAVRAAAAAAAASAGRGVMKPRSVEEDDAEFLNFVVSATLGWRGIRKNGKDVVCSPATARELYADPKSQWVVRQVGAALNDLTLFTKA